MRSALVFLAALIAVVACGDNHLSTIEGRWLLDTVAVNGVFLDLERGLPFRTETGAAVWVDFATDQTLIGQGPCNDFSGRFEFDESRLSPTEVTSSSVACVSETRAMEDWLAVEELVLAALWNGTDVHFSSDIRMQWQTDRATLTFVRAP